MGARRAGKNRRLRVHARRAVRAWRTSAFSFADDAARPARLRCGYERSEHELRQVVELLLEEAVALKSQLRALGRIRTPHRRSRHEALDADLVRTIHGFDALLVLTGSTASANL